MLFFLLWHEIENKSEIISPTSPLEDACTWARQRQNEMNKNNPQFHAHFDERMENVKDWYQLLSTESQD